MRDGCGDTNAGSERTPATKRLCGDGQGIHLNIHKRDPGESSENARRKRCVNTQVNFRAPYSYDIGLIH